MTLIDKIKDGFEYVSDKRKRRDERENQALKHEVAILRDRVRVENEKKRLIRERDELEKRLE